MQSLTQKIFEIDPPGGLFNWTVVRNLFSDSSEGARKLLVYRAVRSGEIHRLRTGVFCLAKPYLRAVPHPYAIAEMLHYPSHISLESALRFHGMVPEALRVVASVSRERARKFANYFGEFHFLRVPTSSARVGVEAVEMGDDLWAFVATPLRALADLIYVRAEVSWKNDGSRFLTDSMRIDPDDLRALPWDELEGILACFNNRRTITYLCGVREEMTADD
jgi:hypothetical protein